MTQSVCQTPHSIPMIAERGSLMSRIATMIAVAHQRNALRHLDPHLLDDIGLSEAEVAQETSRPLWDVPAFWRK